MLARPLIVVCFFLAAGVRLPAQETLSSVQREMDRVEKEIEKEKELHKTERKRAGDFEADKAAKMKALQDQLRMTSARIDSLKRQLERARQQKAGYRNQTALFQGKQKDFVKALTRQIRDLAVSLGRDFPYQREKRAADMEELAVALESGVVGVEEGLNRFFAMMQASLDLAYEVEVYRGTYAEGGASHEGNYVRLGAALLAFASEDGQMAAYLARVDSGYVWKDKDLDADTQRDILTAVKVAQGKVAPQLVNLPFSAPSLKAGALQGGAAAPAPGVKP